LETNATIGSNRIDALLRGIASVSSFSALVNIITTNLRISCIKLVQFKISILATADVVDTVGIGSTWVNRVDIAATNLIRNYRRVDHAVVQVLEGIIKADIFTMIRARAQDVTMFLDMVLDSFAFTGEEESVGAGCTCITSASLVTNIHLST
jgi:exo-beta-1,3-glucanase (GH17 family)